MATLRGPRPLERKDIRGGFHCGVASLDTWLIEHAPGADAAGSARTYVVVDEEQDRVVGYYALTNDWRPVAFSTKTDAYYMLSAVDTTYTSGFAGLEGAGNITRLTQLKAGQLAVSERRRRRPLLRRRRRVPGV